MNQITGQYRDEYYSWQRTVGEFGGKANLFKFRNYIKKEDAVLDYGCGGGFLLEQLDCSLKIGLDINPVIEAPAGVQIYKNCDDLVDFLGEKKFDVVISNHALEHMDSPANALRECYQLLKPGGRIVIVVPSETHKVKYRPNDINNHIITFAPMNLGNLLALSGFKVMRVKRLFHKWPPRYEILARISPHMFHISSYLYGQMKRNSIQLVAVAEKPK
jgi:2-polyprenyl-3-methyl-5-hydroxy-6-metoxy-1,4-benzoquinol methylase